MTNPQYDPNKPGPAPWPQQPPIQPVKPPKPPGQWQRWVGRGILIASGLLVAALIIGAIVNHSSGTGTATQDAGAPSSAPSATTATASCTTNACIANVAQQDLPGSLAKDESVITRAACEPSTVKQNAGDTWTVVCTATYSDGSQERGFANLLSDTDQITFEPSEAAPAAPSPSSTPAAKLTTVGSGNVKACKAISAYPVPHTLKAVYAYMSFLSRESLVATDPELQDAIQSSNAGILGMMAKTVTQAGETKRITKMLTICIRYGVKG